MTPDWQRFTHSNLTFEVPALFESSGKKKIPDMSEGDLTPICNVAEGGDPFSEVASLALFVKG